MKIIPSILLGILFMGNHLCSGQEDNSGKDEKIRPVAFNVPSPKQPLYVLKAGDQTLEFNPLMNEELNPEALDQNSIKSITVLKNEDAKEKYGERGANGVIIMVMKETYILLKEALLKLK